MSRNYDAIKQSPAWQEKHRAIEDAAVKARLEHERFIEWAKHHKMPDAEKHPAKWAEPNFEFLTDCLACEDMDTVVKGHRHVLGRSRIVAEIDGSDEHPVVRAAWCLRCGAPYSHDETMTAYVSGLEDELETAMYEAAESILESRAGR